MHRSLFRHLLASVLLTAVTLSFLPCACAADARVTEDSSITFFIAADPHYISPVLTDNGSYFQYVVENADGKYMPHCEELTDAFIAQVIREKPDALIIPGDITFNGARESHLAFSDKLARIADSGISVFVIPGNHDLNNAMAASFHGNGFTSVESVTPEEFAEIYASCGYRNALSRDSASLSYTAELSDTCHLLMLDVNTPSSPGSLTEETFHWIRSQLESASELGKRVIAVSHQTLLPHSFLSSGVVIYGAEKLLSLYEEYGVLCNLCGHMHVQHIQRSETGLPDIAGSALITWPNQFGILTLHGDDIEYQTERVDTSSITGFDSAALSFLRETNQRQIAAELLSLQTEDSDHSLRDYLVQANIAYIAGREDTLNWTSPLYERWQTIPSLFAFYLRSIREDGQNHTVLHFSSPS